MKKHNKAIWGVEFSKECRKFFLRNINENDWVYEDEDRIYELFADINKDKSNIADSYTFFVDYVGTHFNMTTKETEVLRYLLTGLDWTDIKRCIEILNDEATNDVHEFLVNYNFKIYLDGITINRC